MCFSANWNLGMIYLFYIPTHINLILNNEHLLIVLQSSINIQISILMTWLSYDYMFNLCHLCVISLNGGSLSSEALQAKNLSLSLLWNKVGPGTPDSGSPHGSNLQSRWPPISRPGHLLCSVTCWLIGNSDSGVSVRFGVNTHLCFKVLQDFWRSAAHLSAGITFCPF